MQRGIPQPVVVSLFDIHTTSFTISVAKSERAGGHTGLPLQPIFPSQTIITKMIKT